MTDVKIGLLGFGTVGTGVFRLLQENKENIEAKAGHSVSVKKILVGNLNKDRYVKQEKMDPGYFTTDINEILQDGEINIVIELVGGVENAFEYMTLALEAGKNVITANKDVLALHGRELNKLAEDNGCDIYYEASVGGGIPIIRSILDGFASDNLTEVMGIVNGTTNYILTRMTKDQMSYDEALKLAQELGFAEPDPTSDVKGLDAARKMVILANLSFGMPIELDNVYVRGIDGISGKDIEYMKKLGYIIKLIGYASSNEDGVEAGVQPTVLSENHPLASVNYENNAIYLKGDAVGETMLYGPGAGAMPTATAVVSDLITVIKRFDLNICGKHMFKLTKDKKLKNQDQINARFYLRLKVKDEIGVLHDITDIFTENQLSFESVLQQPTKDGPEIAELIIITHEVVLENYLKALSQLENSERIISIESSYRVL